MLGCPGQHCSSGGDGGILGLFRVEGGGCKRVLKFRNRVGGERLRQGQTDRDRDSDRDRQAGAKAYLSFAIGWGVST